MPNVSKFSIRRQSGAPGSMPSGGHTIPANAAHKAVRNVNPGESQVSNMKRKGQGSVSFPGRQKVTFPS